MFMGSIAALVAMSAWVDWQLSASSEEDFVGSDSVFLVMGAWLLGSITTICLAADHCYIKKQYDPKGICDDGIQITGRIGSFLTIATWAVFVIAVASLVWLATDALGEAGGFCNVTKSTPAPPTTTNTSTTTTTELYQMVAQTTVAQTSAPSSAGSVAGPSDCKMQAEFGLWRYCVAHYVDAFPGARHLVCHFYDDALTDTYGSMTTRTGAERFAFAEVEKHRELAAAAILIAVILAGLADVFSEKFLVGVVFMLLAFFAGLVSFGSMIALQLALKEGVDDTPGWGTGMFVCLGAALVAGVACVLYFFNILTENRRVSEEEYDSDSEDEEPRYKKGHRGRTNSESNA